MTSMSDLDAVKVVLASFRSVGRRVSEPDLEAAWAAFDTARERLAFLERHYDHATVLIASQMLDQDTWISDHYEERLRSLVANCPEPGCWACQYATAGIEHVKRTLAGRDTA